DRHRGITGKQEVRVQRVNRAFGRHRTYRRHQGLPGNLSAEHPLPRSFRLPPAVQVRLDPLEIEQRDEVIKRLRHAEMIPYRCHHSRSTVSAAWSEICVRRTLAPRTA